MRQERLYILVGLFVGGAISLGILIALYAYDEFLREKVETYVMFFKGSLAGIHVSSDVTYRGVKIGEVKRIEIMADTKNQIKIPVYVQFFVERSFVGKSSPIQFLISHGYVACIKKPNFLTGAASIELLESYSWQKSRENNYHGYPIFPTDNQYEEYTSLDDAFNTAKKTFQDISDFVHSQNVKGALDATKTTANSMNRLVNNLNKIIPSTLSNFNQTLKELSLLTTHLDQLMPPAFTAFSQSLKQVSTLATNLDELVPPMAITFNQSMREVANAANSTQNLMDYLARYPESLLRGKK